MRSLIKTKNRKKFISKLFFSFLVLAFSWIWFVPTQVGWNGETSIVRFRFQVFETEEDEYGEASSISTNLFQYRPYRYGWRHLDKRIGGIKEYFLMEETGHDTYTNYEEK